MAFCSNFCRGILLIKTICIRNGSGGGWGFFSIAFTGMRPGASILRNPKKLREKRQQVQNPKHKQWSNNTWHPFLNIKVFSNSSSHFIFRFVAPPCPPPLEVLYRSQAQLCFCCPFPNAHFLKPHANCPNLICRHLSDPIYHSLL